MENEIIWLSSPCGVWIVSAAQGKGRKQHIRVIVPLRGVDCFGKSAQPFFLFCRKTVTFCQL
ncbi:MAG: hypothetical protein ACI3VD_04725 [Candidatus Limivicinus sp.]